MSREILAMREESDKIVGYISGINTASHEASREAEMVLATTEEQEASVKELDHHGSTLAGMSKRLSDIVKRFKL